MGFGLRWARSLCRGHEGGAHFHDDVDVLVGERLCRRGHVAVHVEPGAGLEAAELRAQIVGLLCDEAGNAAAAAAERDIPCQSS